MQRQRHQVIYPEGTRSLRPEGLPLKMGALIAAYQLQWPVQVRKYVGENLYGESLGLTAEKGWGKGPGKMM